MTIDFNLIKPKKYQNYHKFNNKLKQSNKTDFRWKITEYQENPTGVWPVVCRGGRVFDESNCNERLQEDV